MTYRSAHHALICLFDDRGRPALSPWPRKRDGGYSDDDTAPPAGTLSGMEEIAGEAAMVWKHLSRLGDREAAALILRTCPPCLKREGRADPSRPHPIYAGAMRLMLRESADAVSGLSHPRARQAAIRAAIGSKINIGITADRCDVHRRTVTRLIAAMRQWILPIEDRAWCEIEDRLQAAALIERSGD